MEGAVPVRPPLRDVMALFIFPGFFLMGSQVAGQNPPERSGF
jgi:hypothetical protein